MRTKGNLRWIAILALCAAFTIANGVIFAISYQSEKRVAMQINDSLGDRLPQKINSAAVVQESAGKGATASVDGNDAVGQVNIETGTGTKSGSLVHVQFSAPYGTQPFVFISPIDQPPVANWYTTVDTNGFDIWVSTPPKEHANFPFSYFVVTRPWLMYLNK
jgi:hypothetical protein